MSERDFSVHSRPDISTCHKPQWHECFFSTAAEKRPGTEWPGAFFHLHKTGSPAQGLDVLQGLCTEICLSAELHLGCD